MSSLYDNKGKFRDFRGNKIGRDIEHPLLKPANESLEALKAKMAEKNLDIDCRDEVCAEPCRPSEPCRE